MKLRIASDLHTEFYTYTDFKLYEMENEKDQTLIMAGDFCKFSNLSSSGRSREYLNILAERFKDIIYVPGNHEYYDFNLKHFHALPKKDIKKLLHLPKNVHFLDNDTKIFKDICFIGTTLWSDYEKNNPISMFDCKRGINDYRLIFWDGYKTVTPEILYELHKESLKFIINCYEKYPNKRKIIVTHHMPSLQCVDPVYKSSTINGAFASDLDDLIKIFKPELWISGHTHGSYDFSIDKTRLICNPMGYPHNYGDELENINYDKELIIEV